MLESEKKPVEKGTVIWCYIIAGSAQLQYDGTIVVERTGRTLLDSVLNMAINEVLWIEHRIYLNKTRCFENDESSEPIFAKAH
jgi:hypothetical protein